MLPYRSLLIRLFLLQPCVIQRRHRRLGSGVGVSGNGDGRCGFLEVQRGTESEPSQDMADFSMVCGVEPSKGMGEVQACVRDICPAVGIHRLSKVQRHKRLLTAHLAQLDSIGPRTRIVLPPRTRWGHEHWRAAQASMQVSILIRWPSYGNPLGD
ncbi:hypothetical protein BDP81DRAFT_50325 [Colletotrichum phormii]|uniref:Uncharacterized protein n=1 Tax=Colletotrichum phormii TaxID=359342 RepID=A0AAI9ZMD7_9PEZI|nr:uncharacterized protein BDP81DRAFT_50325 [Colletotrichum phormii]KAK1634609.1 hypothetical protein BDP81DRAFT_50325 [Colletotrichum phormii]